MTRVAFTVPGNPVGINATHVGGKRPFVKSPEARAFALAVANRGLQGRYDANGCKSGPVPTILGPVRVTIGVFFRDERPDTDGPVKAILDALQRPGLKARRIGAGVIGNDRQVTVLVVRRHIDPVEPRVEVVVEEMVPPIAAVDCRLAEEVLHDAPSLAPYLKREGAKSTPEALRSILGEKAKTKLMRAKGRLVKSTRDYRRQP